VPLEIIVGQSRDRAAARLLADRLGTVVDEGTVYLGYPVLATADERVDVDALLVSQRHGLVAFVLADDIPRSPESWQSVVEQQDRVYAVLTSHLSRHETLRRGRGLIVDPHTATIFPAPAGEPMAETGDGHYGAIEAVATWVATLSPITPDSERRLQAALQRVTTIKPAKKRSTVTKAASRGAVLKEIEKGIANLDRWQKQAAIESPEGPQRIRGLAGSGKTVVLALKAAYWHAQYPEWHIAVTFHSRALYQQIEDLVTRFTFAHTNDRYDPEYLQILHSWGAGARLGVYSIMASALGQTPRDWAYAQGTFWARRGLQRSVRRTPLSRPHSENSAPFRCRADR
jgi:superfamily I DNA and RNA helicase